MSETTSDEEIAPTDLKWVGEATADVLAESEFDAAHIAEKRVSYRMLVDVGVNPGVAAKIRREHSLSWSFEAGDGLASRSAQVRGLGTAEAEWVAASSGDWEENAESGPSADPADTSDSTDPTDPDDESTWVDDASAPDPAATETDGSGDPLAAEAAWRDRSRPTPVTDLDAVDEPAEALLAEAGITSVRSLATADPEHVADVLDVDADRVTSWHDAARLEHE